MPNHTRYWDAKQRRLLKEIFQEDSNREEDTSLEELETEEENEPSTLCQHCLNKERNHDKGHEKLLRIILMWIQHTMNTISISAFQIWKELFLQIAADVESSSMYFIQKLECILVFNLFFYSS